MDAAQQTRGACKTVHGLEEELHRRHSLEEELHSLEEELHGLKEELHGLEEELQGLEEEHDSPHGHLDLIRQPVHCLSLFFQAPMNAILHSWFDEPANRCVGCVSTATTTSKCKP